MVDMQLKIDVQSDDAIFASYTCPCGCNPGVALRQGARVVTEGCCCGNEFAVGDRASRHIIEQKYVARPGYELQVQPFTAPWGETVEAAWAVGPSQHPAESEHGHGHDDGHGQGHDDAALAPGRAVDPVCGMTVDIEAARATGLHFHYARTDYYFCGRGCRLDFEEDPARFLDPGHIPSM